MAIDSQYQWYDGSDGVDNTRVINNHFRDCRYVPVRLRGGDNHRVIGNTFENCGTFEVGSPQGTKAHIQLGAMEQFSCSMAASSTTLTVTGNTLWTHDAGDESKYEGMPLVFHGSSIDSNLTEFTTYYVLDTISDTTCTISATIGGAAITFSGSGGTGTASGRWPAGTGHQVMNNVSIKGSNDHFIETNDADEDDVGVYGNTVIGYEGEAFSDRFGLDDGLQAQYANQNTGM
jgi:hypothetical protein